MNSHALVANWITLRNQQIALWLIEKHEVQQGYRLAYYLKVPLCNDNYTSVCMWVQYQSQINPKRFTTLGELSAGFVDLIPQHFFR